MSLVAETRRSQRSIGELLYRFTIAANITDLTGVFPLVRADMLRPHSLELRRHESSCSESTLELRVRGLSDLLQFRG